MYEMLCGVPPFRAKSRQALQQQIATGKVKYPSESACGTKAMSYPLERVSSLTSVHHGQS